MAGGFCVEPTCILTGKAVGWLVGWSKTAGKKSSTFHGRLVPRRAPGFLPPLPFSFSLLN
jgi:hypothetical protein